MRTPSTILSILCLGLTAFAQTASRKTTTPATKAVARKAAQSQTSSEVPSIALPTPEQVDASMQRTFGYDPAIRWKILDIEHSAIPGVAHVLVSINNQNPVNLYVSHDLKHAIVGDMLPFGSDPFASTRAVLKGKSGPSRGAQNPVIDVVEFSDLECPHCKAAQPVLEKLVNDFPQIRYTFQQFPLPASLHPWAMKAARYAQCAGEMNKDAFWKYVDAIFENQGSIAEATADDQLKGLAGPAGLDADKLAACAAAPASESAVDKSLELGRSLDVNETPTVFINGREVKAIANIPYEQLKALVQFEIDHAGK